MRSRGGIVDVDVVVGFEVRIELTFPTCHGLDRYVTRANSRIFTAKDGRKNHSYKLPVTHQRTRTKHRNLAICRQTIGVKIHI